VDVPGFRHADFIAAATQQFGGELIQDAALVPHPFFEVRFSGYGTVASDRCSQFVKWFCGQTRTK
jgi:hypothetical protein